jgi:hypothetical protein
VLVQTPPDTTVAYDVNQLTLLQTGTAIITQENFAPATGYAGAPRRRLYISNVQGTVETLAPLAPFQVTDPDRTFAVELDESGTVRGYVGSFTPAEQEFASAALRFTCFSYNRTIDYLLASFPAGGNTGGFTFQPAPCSGTFTSLHPGWNAVLDAETAALSAPVTETVAVDTEPPQPAEGEPDVPGLEDEATASAITDADSDPVDCNTFQPATGSVIFWNLKGISAVQNAAGIRLTATLEGGENIPGVRYFFFRVQVGDEPQKLYAVDLEGSTVIGAGERNQVFQLLPGTENTMQIEPPNRVSLQIESEEFRVFAASGVVGSACDKFPDTASQTDPSTWSAIEDMLFRF